MLPFHLQPIPSSPLTIAFKPTRYVSADSYVFEPSSGSQPGLMISEKAERETLTIDRRSGKMTLNGEDLNQYFRPPIRLSRRQQRSDPKAGSIESARNNTAPLGREKVITCYGIVGIVSLATSKSSNQFR